jgi:sigma-B regulation protein RsbU (phosphoserine phosphatase)
MPLRPPPDADDRLRDIRSVTDAALSYLGADDLLNVLLRRVREALDADTAAVLLLDRSGRQLIATAATGLEEEVIQGVRIPVGSGFAGRIAAERRPVILDRVDHDHVLNPILLEKGIRSMVGVPLLVNGAAIGVMHVGTQHDRVFTEDDAALLQLAADRAALAVQSMRSRDDRAAVAAVQGSLLPSAPLAVRGAEVAARYVPGDGQFGGDWYDVFPLPDGELGVVVGDVAGSGLASAIIMGRMRSALRSYALEFPDPAEVLTKLDRKMQYFEDEPMATVSYAMLDPASGRLRISLAGHFPPVIAAPGEHGALAEVAVDAPIGVADCPARQVTTLTVVPGSVLCFFTDGLVERRDRPLDDGLERLCRAVSARPPESVCVSVMGALVGREHPGDDIALLTLRWHPEPALSMQDGPRILVAAALGRIVEPLLRQSFPDAAVRIAEDEAAVEAALRDRLRFDVAVIDLTWNDYAVEFSFDGLDVLASLRRAGRQTPVIFAAQGHGLERDHLDEAVEQPEVVGVYRKATGPQPLMEAIDIAAGGGSLTEARFPPGASPPQIPRIHCYFGKGRGTTAARLAGAIASGRAVNHETLAGSAHVGYDTAAKLVDYLGPLIRERHEHGPGLKMTPEVVYRWCGEHARYILSWCRRNDHADVATRVTAPARLSLRPRAMQDLAWPHRGQARIRLIARGVGPDVPFAAIIFPSGDGRRVPGGRPLACWPGRPTRGGVSRSRVAPWPRATRLPGLTSSAAPPRAPAQPPPAAAFPAASSASAAPRVPAMAAGAPDNAEYPACAEHPGCCQVPFFSPHAGTSALFPAPGWLVRRAGIGRVTRLVMRGDAPPFVPDHDLEFPAGQRRNHA